MMGAETHEPVRRILPHYEEAEHSVIGGVLFNGKAFTLVADILDASDFYDAKHEAIWSAFMRLDSTGQTIDIVSVSAEMRRAGLMTKLGAHGNEVYLATLMNQVATTENIVGHARIVKDKALVRGVILETGRLQQLGYSDEQSGEQLLDAAQAAFFALGNGSVRSAYEPARTVLHKTLTNLEARFRAKKSITGVPTGFHRFDEMTAGLQPNELVIVAARPSMGKTSFVMNCVEFAAIDQKVPCLIFSLEMEKKQLMERMLCSRACVESQKMRSGFLESRDWIGITKASALIAESPIVIDDSGSPTITEIRAKARRWRADPSIWTDSAATTGLIVIDYLQLVKGSNTNSKEYSREREISEISRSLKALAKELRCPVVALSQLNRSLENRADKRPMLSDLRESGAIEQDADTICFIYRDEYYNKESKDKGIAEIIIGKQRSGPTGTAQLAWVSRYTQFGNLAESG